MSNYSWSNLIVCVLLFKSIQTKQIKKFYPPPKKKLANNKEDCWNKLFGQKWDIDEYKQNKCYIQYTERCSIS